MATYDQALDARAMEVFRQAIEEVGGAVEIAKRHEQDMLPALLESAYVLVLAEEGHKSPEEIGETLGITPGAVNSVFEAPMEMFVSRVRQEEDELPEFEPHTDPDWSGAPLTPRLEPEFTVGALAKFAYSIVKRQGVQPPDVHVPE